MNSSNTGNPAIWLVWIQECTKMYRNYKRSGAHCEAGKQMAWFRMEWELAGALYRFHKRQTLKLV